MLRATRSVVVSVFCIVLVSAGSASADWPQWRGPNRDAKAVGFKAPETWPKTLTKKWSNKVGDGVATPSLADGKLYVFTRQDNQEILRCLNAATGDELWKEGYESEGIRGPAGGFAGPRCTPTVADGKVVTLGVRGVLICREAASGKQLWRKDEHATSWPMFYTSSSPLVVDGLCIAQLGGAQDGGIIAYDLTSGQEKWNWMKSGPGYASPVLMTVDGTKVIFAPTDQGRGQGKLVALNAADGQLVWEIPYNQGRYISTTPIVDGSTLIIAGPGSGMSALKFKKEGDKLKEETAWNITENSIGFNTPVLKDGLVFGLSSADQLFCINTQTQKTGWSAPFAKPAAADAAAPKAATNESRDGRVKVAYAQFVQQEQPKDSEKKDGERPDDRPRRRFGPGGPGRGEGPGGFRRGGRGMGRSGYGSIVDVGSALLGLTPAGELVVFEPSGDAFKELARYKVADGSTYAYPVPAGNGIYIKDKESVTLWTVE